MRLSVVVLVVSRPQIDRQGALFNIGVKGYYWTNAPVSVGGSLGYGRRAVIANGSLNVPEVDGNARNAYCYGFSLRPVAE